MQSMYKMTDGQTEVLEEIAKQSHICPNKDCCNFGAYASCYNHSHILCNEFESWYQNKLDNLKPKHL